jgi:hypothetical protein
MDASASKNVTLLLIKPLAGDLDDLKIGRIQKVEFKASLSGNLYPIFTVSLYHLYKAVLLFEYEEPDLRCWSSVTFSVDKGKPMNRIPGGVA